MILYMIDKSYFTSFRYACAIADPDGPSVVLTGGQNTLNTVSRYDRTGWVEDLANLTVGRQAHGCAGYMKDGELVSRYSENYFILSTCICLLLCKIKVYLVVGGYAGAARTDTTEVYSGGRWRTVGALPEAVYRLAGVTIESTVYMTGLYKTGDVLDVPHTCFRRAGCLWLQEGHLEF